mmetsp:Transcript_7222/g.11398  ORF Transcript_7222/g.11398 Transcript_7222/m.11398 type:complete len:188 (-) Transcript_7222:17-580(-)
MPLEVLSTRLMTGAAEGGILQALLTSVKKDGFMQLYTGVRANFLLCFSPAIKHMVFDQVKAKWVKTNKSLSTSQSFALGAFATVIASTITFPAMRARAVLQSKRVPAGSNLRKNANVFDIMAFTLENKGFTGLYQGLAPQLLKGVLSSAFMLSAKESLHNTAETIVKALMYLYLLSRKSAGMCTIKG